MLDYSVVNCGIGIIDRVQNVSKAYKFLQLKNAILYFILIVVVNQYGILAR